MPLTQAPTETSADRPPLRRRLGALDHAASAAISESLPHPRALTIPLGALSLSANYGILWFVIAAIPWLSGTDHGPAIFVYVAGAVFATELITNVVKRLFGRRRPSQDGLDRLIPMPVSASFPSSHASMGVVGMLALGTLYPHWRVALVALVTVLCFTRIYLRVHYLTDVAGGLLLGAALGIPYVLLMVRP
jgi:membrane-associated phospholipid phosphatase